MTGILHRRRKERNEFGRREHEVRCWEVPLVAGHENRILVKQGQSRFKKHPVIFIGKSHCTWRWLDKSTVFAEMGNYRVCDILPKVEFRARQDFLIFCQNFYVKITWWKFFCKWGNKLHFTYRSVQSTGMRWEEMVIELSYRACHSMRIPQNDVMIYTLPYPIKRIHFGA